MTAEQINKSIKQMRSMFGFFGILTGLGALSALAASANDLSYLVVFLLEVALSTCYWLAFVNLGQRNRKGHLFATIASILFLPGFPVLTVFGILYLRKLSKPEMKEALGVTANLEK